MYAWVLSSVQLQSKSYAALHGFTWLTSILARRQPGPSSLAPKRLPMRVGLRAGGPGACGATASGEREREDTE